MVDGKGYNGVSVEEIKAAEGCPRGSINALKDGVVTRGVLFDATRLPGKATRKAGWSREPRFTLRISRPWNDSSSEPLIIFHAPASRRRRRRC